MLAKISEIIHALNPTKEGEAFFQFRSAIGSEPIIKKVFADIGRRLNDIDEEQWKLLLPKIVEKYKKKEKNRGWQQAYNVLQEGIAYSFLKRDGYSEIKFLPRQSQSTPDLVAKRGTAEVTIEVKSINKSESQIVAEQDISVQSLGLPLGEKFFAKLQSTLFKASKQLAFQKSDEKVIFLFVEFDDISNQYILNYLCQIRSWLRTHIMLADKYYIHCHPAYYFSSTQSSSPHLIVCLRNDYGVVETS